MRRIIFYHAFMSTGQRYCRGDKALWGLDAGQGAIRRVTEGTGSAKRWVTPRLWYQHKGRYPCVLSTLEAC